MPSSARIIRKRYIRKRRAGRTGRIIVRGTIVFLLLAGIGMGLFLITVFTGTAAAFEYFTQDLPDFSQIEKLGQDIDTTFETTKIFAWSGDEDQEDEGQLIAQGLWSYP